MNDEGIICNYEREYDNWKREKKEDSNRRVKDEIRGVLSHRVVHNRFRS